MSTPANVERAIEGVILYRVGSARAIRGREVISILRAAGHRCHLRRVSETAQSMRQRGFAVLSTSSVPRGYYVADTIDEVERALSELRRRRSMLDDAIRNLEASAYLRVTPRLPGVVPVFRASQMEGLAP